MLFMKILLFSISMATAPKDPHIYDRCSNRVSTLVSIISSSVKSGGRALFLPLRYAIHDTALILTGAGRKVVARVHHNIRWRWLRL